MSQLRWRISQALDEARILVLGAQVFIGFEYLSFFENGFVKLPRGVQLAKVGGLALMLLAFALLAAPATYHQIAESGRQSSRFLRYVSNLMKPALLPFAVAFGIDAYVVGIKVEPRWAFAAGAAVTLTALFMWWGIAMMVKRKRPPAQQEPEQSEASLHEKIDDVLTEVRVVLPGAQALLAFQFNTVLKEAFEKLSRPLQLLHVSSLVFVTISTILLMTPAAYHRIVERGEATARFHRFASRMLIAAMVPLALGLCSDFGVVAMVVTRSVSASAVAAGILLMFFFVLWFGYTTLVRSRSRAGAKA